MRYSALAAFLLTALYVAPAPAPDFRPVEIDMAQACATVSPPICSTRPGDHTYLKTPKFLPQPTVYMDTSDIGPSIAVFLTITFSICFLIIASLYKETARIFAQLRKLD